jgi:hypothetical protein
MIDLIFSNILYQQTWIRNNIYIISDHKTQVIIIPSKGRAKLEQVYYRIIELDFLIFVGLIRNKLLDYLTYNKSSLRKKQKDI